MARIAPYVFLAALTGAAFAADNGNTIASIYSDRESKPAADQGSAFWKGIDPVIIESDYMGEPMPRYRTEVRSRWTKNNLYLLFVCPYEEFWLKPNPDALQETNELWKWDVAEAFLGSDLEHINRYREFEVSPHGEWIDLDIDRGNPRQAGWNWNSGFEVKARIDEKLHLWYAEMVIPWSAFSGDLPKEGGELRANFFLSVGESKKNLAWRTPHKRTFHAPEAFGILKLKK
jgi:hypothetical protein